MEDPYKVLGVDQDANEATIKKAYRRLAKLYHPDHNAGDPLAGEKFSQAADAYELLKDRDRRGQYDQGMIDADGNPSDFLHQTNNFTNFKDFNSDGYWHSTKKKANHSFFEDIFKDLFSDNFKSHAQTTFSQSGDKTAKKGKDIRVSTKIAFETAALGGRVVLKLPNNRQVNVKIPPGSQTGRQIKLKGLGFSGSNGGQSGDCLVKVEVKPHPLFKVQGQNLTLELPITLYEAVLGGNVRVPSLTSPVTVKIPPGSSSGRIMRIKGYGIKPEGGGGGDLLAKIMVCLPKRNDPGLEALMRIWRTSKPYSPK